MKIENLALASICSIGLVCAAGCREEGEPPQPPATDTTTTPAPTGANQGTTGTQGTTGAPGDQGAAGQPTAEDRQTTERVRMAIVEDTALPMSAREITIVTNAGVVTLSGNVDSEMDRDAIVLRVESVEGVERVDDRLQVQPAGAPGSGS